MFEVCRPGFVGVVDDDIPAGFREKIPRGVPPCKYIRQRGDDVLKVGAIGARQLTAGPDPDYPIFACHP